MAKFDVVVIGAGPGGYIAAIRAAQLGFSTACVEEWRNPEGEPALGGTCLNVGCIPSKALLESSEQYEHAGHQFGEHGITVTGAQARRRQDAGAQGGHRQEEQRGIEYLFARTRSPGSRATAGSSARATPATRSRSPARSAETLVGEARDRRDRVERARTCRARRSTKADPATTTARSRFREVPKRLGVIGAGVIGLELGSVWRRLGAEVTLLEALPTFLGAADEASRRKRRRLFNRQGLKIHLGVAIGNVKADKKGVTVDYTDAKGEAQTLAVRPADRVDRARAEHDGTGRRGGRADDRRARLRRGRRRLPHQPSERVGDRRRRARADARAQGRGRRRHGGRADRRPEGARQLQHHPVGDLHLARDRLGRHRPSSS